MKNIWMLIVCVGITYVVKAQSGSVKKNNNYAAPSRDYVMIQLGYDAWSGKPDSIKTGGIGRFVNAYLCYDFPIMKTNFSFAAGAGVSVSNIYFKNQVVLLTDTSTFVQFVPEKTNFKKHKLATAYIEAPFELRYFGNKENRNKGFKAALGLKVGALVSSHTKSKYTFNNKPIVEKISTKRYLETWRYTASLRLGYGNFSVYGGYSIGSLFRVGNGPESIRPYQIGICLSGL